MRKLSIAPASLLPALMLALLAALFLPAAAAAGKPAGAAPDTTEAAPEVPRAEQSVTDHQIVIAGERLDYTATAGTFIVRNEQGQAYASIGYFAYTARGGADPGRRPLTFAYNGGPGACSLWLHMGALGPRRIVTRDADFTAPPPYRVVDNEQSILDATDLVLIDPVGTGFSRAVGEARDKDFYGVDADIESVARFIAQYVTEAGRWNSPKYLLGESYGTLRSAGVVDWLQSHRYMDFNGLVMVAFSPDLEALFSEIPGNERPYALALPSYTAVAWYHKVLPDQPAELAPLLREARDFALGEYSHALALGSDLSDSERAAVLDRLHRYTGLSVDYLDRANLRVTTGEFGAELLREHRETIGQLDGRFLGAALDPLAKAVDSDAMDAATSPAFVAAFLDYLHRDLKFAPAGDYVIDANVWTEWDWRHKVAGAPIPQPMANTSVDLAHAMVFNPHLRVLALQGIYDLATTMLAAEWMIAHLDLPDALRRNIEMRTYEAGHMMYVHEPSLKRFRADVTGFIDETSGR